MNYFAWLLATAGLPTAPVAPPAAPAVVAPLPVVVNVRPAGVAQAYATMRAVLDAPPGSVAPPPAPAPTPPPAPAAAADAAQLLVAWVNAARTAAGLSSYVENPVLMRLAAERAQALAQSGLFTHDIPGLGLPLAMEQAAGLQAWGMGAENLAEAGTIQQAFALLMASPEHRSNILNPYETQIGVGVAPLPNGGVVVSQLFMGPAF